MSKEYFFRHHAYTGIPALIKGGAKNWSALHVFNYQYFKKLYSKGDALETFEENGCSFFGYKTNFRTLKHVFKMSKKRSELKKDQWYIGWYVITTNYSMYIPWNCNGVKMTLLKHLNHDFYGPEI